MKFLPKAGIKSNSFIWSLFIVQKQLFEKFVNWFDEYVAGFYGSDEFVNENIKLKEDHSRRVCSEMQFLVDRLNLTDEQKAVARIVALFHDIGRFEQFKKYRTYNDHKSVDHSQHGLQVIRQHRLLGEIDSTTKQIIEKSIAYHNLMELPEDLSGELLLQARLIRDADKLDIFYIVIQYYKKIKQDPEAFRLEVELPDNDSYSEKVLNKVLTGQRINYRDLHNWNDMKLCQLSWIYDINFQPTFERIREKQYLQKIISILPSDSHIQALKEHVLRYVDKKTG